MNTYFSIVLDIEWAICNLSAVERNIFSSLSISGTVAAKVGDSFKSEAYYRWDKSVRSSVPIIFSHARIEFSISNFA